MFLRIFSQRAANRQPRSAWRSLFLVLIFCGVAWAFWQNAQTQMHRLTANSNVWDDPPALSENEREALQKMIAQFKSRYGIDVRMEVLEVPLHAPASRAPQIYIGINPKTGDFLLEYPPWLRLEPDFANQIKADYIQPRLAKQQYAYALADALRALWEELKAQETIQQTAPNEHGGKK